MRFRLRAVVALWDKFQVELHGWYTPQRVLAVAQYVRGITFSRVLLVLIATPLPCLLATVLVDTLKLADPYSGLQNNGAFIFREYVVYWIMSFLGAQQFRTSVVTLPLSNFRVVVSTFIVAGSSVAILYAIALVVGFPVPFTIIAGCPGWVASILISLALAWVEPLRTNPEAWSLVTNVLKVWMCQVGLVVVYPTYFYVFTTLSASGKTAFSLLLPPMKLVARNVFTRTVVHLRDEMPEVVIFNAEVFNALFSSYCFQNSPSIWTTAGLMTADLIQSYLSLRDVNTALKALDALRKEMRRQGHYHDQIVVMTEPTALELARWILEQGKRRLALANAVPPNASVLAPAPPSKGSRNSLLLPRIDSIVPALDEKPESGRQNSVPIKVLFTREVRRLLYMTEFIVMVNYVEVIIPLVFSIYLVTMYHLSNAGYYEQLIGMSEPKLLETLRNVLVYAFLQLGSLLLLTSVLRAKLRFSAIHQLAFVLERQWTGVQIKLVFWVLYNVQASLRHFGFDYSFRFSWLRDSSDAGSD